MIILPAIDMMSGRPVRLYKGEYESSEVVADSVIETAKRFEAAGAEWIHMVDLDGAKTGKRENAQLITETAQNCSIPVEAGGGIRTMEDISFYIENGVSRVILGTAAVSDEALLKEALAVYGDKIAVGMDCRNGYAAVSGWLKTSELYYLDFAKHLEEIGVKTVIFTDISKDGTLSGPNFEMLRCLSGTTNMNIIASGGVRDLKNIRDLAAMNLYGAITGKAIYAGTMDLSEAIAAAGGKL